MFRALRSLSLAVSVSLIASVVYAAPPSPLQVVVDGRTAAKSSKLTEKGMAGLAQSGLNVFLIACGLAGVMMVGFGMWTRYQAELAGPQRAGGPSAMWMIVAGSLLTISAIIAAVIPYAVL